MNEIQSKIIVASHVVSLPLKNSLVHVSYTVDTNVVSEDEVHTYLRRHIGGSFL